MGDVKVSMDFFVFIICVYVFCLCHKNSIVCLWHRLVKLSVYMELLLINIYYRNTEMLLVFLVYNLAIAINLLDENRKLL